MMKTLRVLPALAFVTLGGCATIVKGTTQTVAIDTNPTGATCTVTREGAQLAKIESTPGKIELNRSKHALAVSCVKGPEYQNPTTQTVESQFNGVTAGNILIGGLIGVAVDASTGANNTYPEQVTVNLVPTPAAMPSSATAVPGSTPAATAPTTTMQPVNDEEPSKPKKPTKPKTPKAPEATTPPGN